jgi:hypothetical protein
MITHLSGLADAEASINVELNGVRTFSPTSAFALASGVFRLNDSADSVGPSQMLGDSVAAPEPGSLLLALFTASFIGARPFARRRQKTS